MKIGKILGEKIKSSRHVKEKHFGELDKERYAGQTKGILQAV